ncbi:MAG TPA: hypothetical protein VHB21_11155 [Minicystis sp.]|nr:hypothetical protein [Minicystis sp.]
MSRAALALLLALAAPACSPFGGTEGALGNGEFFYQCVGDGDAACLDEHEHGVEIEVTSADGSKMPRSVAVGAPFNVIFQANDDTLDQVEPASSELVESSNEGLSFTRPATVSIVASSVGGFADFIDVTGEEVAELRLFQHGAEVTQAVKLSVGDTLDVTAIAMGASGNGLAGQLPWAWTSDDESVAGVGPRGFDSTNPGSLGPQVTVTAEAKGATTISISVNGKTQKLPVTVSD